MKRVRKKKANNCGVYEIRNIVSGKRYIGSSIYLKGRLNDHRSLLNRGKHTCIHLQRSWDKHGENVFQFSVIQIVPEGDLLMMEQKLLDAAKKSGEILYNIAKDAEAPTRGLTSSEETKAKLRKAQRKRWDNPDNRAAARTSMNQPEVRQRLSEASKAAWADPEIRQKYLNKFPDRPPITEDGRQRVSESLIKQWQDPESRSKRLSGIMNPEFRAAQNEAMRGKSMSPETRAKMAAAQRARREREHHSRAL